MSVSTIERIKKGQLWDFPGGVFPDERKSLSNQQEIQRIDVPDTLYIPVKQHVGVEGRVCVEVGQQVLKGQPLTQSSNPFAVPVHAPTSGEIISIKDHVSAHPSGIPEKTIELKTDGKERWVDLNPVADFTKLSPNELTELICSAGISGMGGAGFPTHIKLASHKNIEFLIINGVECEPYITSDDRLMREHAWQIRQGIDVLFYIIQPKHILIAVEDNKPEAKEALSIAFQDIPDLVICDIPTKYPAGGEKQLIQVLTGREVPSGGLPADVGALMYNVGTCFAVADAVFAGKPLIERVVTLTGKALDKPQNVWALLGTPMSHLLKTAEYRQEKQKQKSVIMGGPMMGFSVHDEKVPTVKITNCVLVPEEGELVSPDEELPCIRCGACADACPAGLLPQQLYWHAKGKEYDKVEEHNLFDCIECGACAFVCPSFIPLVHYYRKAKADIRQQQDEQLKADKARERFEARKDRLEREKLAREEKARLAAEARRAKSEQKSSSGAASDRVAAALARAKAKKQSQTEGAETASEDSKAAPAQETQGEHNNEADGAVVKVDPKEAQRQRVADAIARAKAKKASKEQDTVVSEDEPVDSAAVASEATVEPEKQEMSDTQKRVAAAIARAKAKKAAKDNSEE